MSSINNRKSVTFNDSPTAALRSDTVEPNSLLASASASTNPVEMINTAKSTPPTSLRARLWQFQEYIAKNAWPWARRVLSVPARIIAGVVMFPVMLLVAIVCTITRVFIILTWNGLR